MLQVQRVLLFQLPPHGFWFWLCNGLQVYDALVVALWVAINVLYVEQKTRLVLSVYRSVLTVHTCCEFQCQGLQRLLIVHA